MMHSSSPRLQTQHEPSFWPGLQHTSSISAHVTVPLTNKPRHAGDFEYTDMIVQQHAMQAKRSSGLGASAEDVVEYTLGAGASSVFSSGGGACAMAIGMGAKRGTLTYMTWPPIMP